MPVSTGFFRKAVDSRNGFTLLELMVVIVIIGVLVAIGVPVYNNIQRSAAQRAHDANLRVIDTAVVMFQAGEGRDVDNLKELRDLGYIQEIPMIPAALARQFEGIDGYYISGDPLKSWPVGDWDGYRSGDSAAEGGDLTGTGE